MDKFFEMLSNPGGEGLIAITDHIKTNLVGQDAFAIPKSWEAMVRNVRNLGWRGPVPRYYCARGGENYRRAAADADRQARRDV